MLKREVALDTGVRSVRSTGCMSHLVGWMRINSFDRRLVCVPPLSLWRRRRTRHRHRRHTTALRRSYRPHPPRRSWGPASASAAAAARLRTSVSPPAPERRPLHHPLATRRFCETATRCWVWRARLRRRTRWASAASRAAESSTPSQRPRRPQPSCGSDRRTEAVRTAYRKVSGRRRCLPARVPPTPTPPRGGGPHTALSTHGAVSHQHVHHGSS
jgi:hypothetical protein